MIVSIMCIYFVKGSHTSSRYVHYDALANAVLSYLCSPNEIQSGFGVLQKIEIVSLFVMKLVAA